jgi:hypothetical protein
MEAILGASKGVFRLNGGTVSFLGLDRERISAVYASRNSNGDLRILAGSYESGLFISDDDGKSWREVGGGFSALCVRWIGDDPLQPSALLAGTEPGRIFRSTDGGSTWKELSGIRKVPGHENWFLPYSPRAGAVRNIFSPPGRDRYYASVEVGGLLTSDDTGATWSCDPVTIDTDIHFVTGSPDDGRKLFAALGYAGIDRSPNPETGPMRRGGVARSTDGGKTWTKLFTDYTRAVIIPESRTDIVIAGPSPDVGHNGRIEVSFDGGDSWRLASDGIETPMPDMVELFEPAPDGSIWAICSGGRLLRATPDDLQWTPVVSDQGELKIESVAFFEGND